MAGATHSQVTRKHRRLSLSLVGVGRNTWWKVKADIPHYVDGEGRGPQKSMPFAPYTSDKKKEKCTLFSEITPHHE